MARKIPKSIRPEEKGKELIADCYNSKHDSDLLICTRCVIKGIEEAIKKARQEERERIIKLINEKLGEQ